MGYMVVVLREMGYTGIVLRERWAIWALFSAKIGVLLGE